jgi:serine/threonine protein kinase
MCLPSNCTSHLCSIIMIEIDVPCNLQHNDFCVCSCPSLSTRNNSSSLDHPNLRCSDRSLHDFDILKLLGTGGTGHVYLARDKRTSKLIAIKIICKKNCDQAQLDDVANEQQVHQLISECNGNYILPLLGSWHDSFNFFIVTVRLVGLSIIYQGLTHVLVLGLHSRRRSRC